MQNDVGVMMGETTKALTTLSIGDGFHIPVSVVKLATPSDVQLDSASPKGNPMKTVRIDMATGDEVESDDVKKGVFRSKPKKSQKATWGDFAEISKEDLDAIDAATSLDSFAVGKFIPLKDVPMERVTGAYYLAPAEGMSPKPLVLLARALKKAKRAGVFKMVKAKRQYLAVVYERDGALIVNTLAFSSDFAAVQEAAAVLQRQPVALKPAEVELATRLVGEALAEDASVLDEYEDDLIPLRAELVDLALAGKLPKPKPKTEVGQEEPDDDLEARLRDTLDLIKDPPPKRKAAVPVG